MATTTDRSEFLGRPITADYRPTYLGLAGQWYDHRGWFSLYDVERMRKDGQVSFGMRILRAPLHTVTWTIESEPAEVQQWVDRTLKFVWERELTKLTRILEYGYMGGENCWHHDPETDTIEYTGLRDLNPFDIRPLAQHGRLAGLSVKGLAGKDSRGVWLRPPRSFWLANESEYGNLYGRPRIATAWYPWMEKMARHGAVDIRRLWFLKNAYRGGIIRHPTGTIEVANGQYMSNQDYARELVEKMETGGVLALPNISDERGNQLWVFEEPKINGDPRGVREYPQDLDKEILVGMGIQPEVAQAAEVGGGWSGRSVPFLVFLTSEDQIADCIFHAIDEQILRPGVDVNFGEGARYKVHLKSLVPPAEDKQAKQQGKGPGDRPGGGGQPAEPDEDDGANGGGQLPQQLSHEGGAHAPAGGVTIGGQEFKGGQFIPGEVLARATPKEKAKVVGKGKGKTSGKAKATNKAPDKAAGFTGEKKDKLGRRICYDEGKRTPCPKPPKPEKPVKPTVDELHAEVAKLKQQGVTHDTLHVFAGRLAMLNLKEIGELKNKLGVRAAGPKAELAKKIAALALTPAPTAEEAAAKIKAVKTAGAASPEQAKEVAELLAKLRVKDLESLKKQFGVRAAGTKAELANKIAERVFAPPKPPKPEKTVKPPKTDKAILNAMEAVEGPDALRAGSGAMVSMRELRQTLKDVLPGAAFDRAIFALARRGGLELHLHDFPSELSVEQKAQLLSQPAEPDSRGEYGGRRYFTGVSLRDPDKFGEAGKTLAPGAVAPPTAPPPKTARKPKAVSVPQPAPAASTGPPAAAPVPDAIHRAFGELVGSAHSGMVELADLRDRADQLAGRPLSRQEFDGALQDLRRAGLIRPVAAGNLGDKSERTKAAAVRGTEGKEVFTHAEAGQKYAPPPSAAEAPAKPVAPATPQPSPPAPRDAPPRASRTATPATPPATPIDLANPSALADAVHEAGKGLKDFFGNAHGGAAHPGYLAHTVPVSDLYDALKGRLPAGTDLARFKQALLKAYLGGTLVLKRNDLPQVRPEAGPPSEISYLGATFHGVDVNPRK